MDLFNQAPDTKSLFDRLCEIETLRDGFKAVRRNKGAHGIDGVTVDDFADHLEEELGQIQTELWSWTYQPKPVRGVEIPKPQGGKRLLGIPCIRDRVIQAAIKALLEPLLDPKFSDHSYGFRPGRSQKQAIEAAEAFVASGKKYVVDIDLSKFFDRIHHDRLIGRLSQVIADKRLLRLIGLTLRSGIMKDGLVSPTTEGATQGSPLSPLLSNVVLDELDRELERRGLSFCRFADDCNVFVASPVAAERAMRNISEFIEHRLKLVVNREKSQVAPANRVVFLGMTIVGRASRAISSRSMARAYERVRELTPRGTHLPLEKTIARLNSWYVGWSNYYGMTRFPYQLVTLEAHIRRRLRTRLLFEQKRRRNLCAKLVTRGLRRESAARIAFSNNGPWALAGRAGTELAFSNDWFASQGLKTVSDQVQEHWFHIRSKPRLK